MTRQGHYLVKYGINALLCCPAIGAYENHLAKQFPDKNSAVSSYGIGTRIIAHYVSKYAAEAVEKECLMPRGRIQIENRDLVVQ